MKTDRPKLSAAQVKAQIQSSARARKPRINPSLMRPKLPAGIVDVTLQHSGTMFAIIGAPVRPAKKK